MQIPFLKRKENKKEEAFLAIHQKGKKKMRRFFALLSVFVITSAVFAAEEQNGDFNPERSGRGDARRSGMRRRGGMGGGRIFFGGMSMLQRFKAEQDISRKFPNEYAEAEKQLFEAEAKLKELAKKAKVDLPNSIEGKLRELKHKQPEAFARIVADEDNRKAMMDVMKLAKDNGLELFPNMRGGDRRGRPEADKPAQAPEKRRTGRVNFEKLRKLYPEEMKKLDELRTSDPQAFRDGLRDLNKKMESEQINSENNRSK